MTIFEKIIFGLYVLGWIAAPLIVQEIFKARHIVLPSDIATGGIVIWYAIPVLQNAWLERNNPKKRSNSRGPSYTDRGQNDWGRMD